MQNNAWAGTPKKVSVSGDMLSAFQEKAKAVQESMNKYMQFNQGLKELEVEARKATTSDQEKGNDENKEKRINNSMK